MSILIIEVLPQGMIFAADRNITVKRRELLPDETVWYVGQDIGSKIVRWPRHKALLGAVGAGQIGGGSTQDWLYDFMGDHVDFSDPRTVAMDLKDRLQSAFAGVHPPKALIVEFGAFARRDGIAVPEMWHVSNIHGMNQQTGDYDPATREFGASEEILGNRLKNIAPQALRAELQRFAAAHNPFWFHQGVNLIVFNTLEQKVKEAFERLQRAGKLQPPQSLEDWERHARMWVLIYGAYFEAFEGPGQKLVGGGADVLSIPWPSS